MWLVADERVMNDPAPGFSHSTYLVYRIWFEAYGEFSDVE
jgi:hypothetical protein